MARNQSNRTHGDGPAHSVQPRPLVRFMRAPQPANDNQRKPPAVRHDSAIPRDARAVIEPVERSVTQSGRARVGSWRLRFRPRSAFHVDPLTGWTGGSDPLRHVELAFPSREAAIAYARRQGLAFDVREPRPRPPFTPNLQAWETQGPVRLCCWPTGPHALCCGRYPVEFGEGDHAQPA